MPIAVVYLARLCEGIEHLTRFAESYRRHKAGEAHRLVVVFKADDWTLQDQARAVFADIPHQALTVTDGIGIDLDAYLWAARQIGDGRLCFLNTFSEILCDDWLAKLNDNLTGTVAIAGATGSYEALLQSLKLYSKVIWLCSTGRIGYDAKIADHYRDILTQHAPGWMRQGWLSKIKAAFVGSPPELFNAEFADYWDDLTAPGGALHWYRQFPLFPNPHVRSNAFMIRRADFLKYLAGTHCGTKENGSLIESGKDSLTAKIIRDGKRAIVVDRFGGGHAARDWPRSNTFRAGNQAGLMIADNRTRLYAGLSDANKLANSWVTWGVYGDARLPRGLDFDIGLPCKENQLLPASYRDRLIGPAIAANK